MAGKTVFVFLINSRAVLIPSVMGSLTFDLFLVLPEFEPHTLLGVFWFGVIL